jgi:hypothetical protein
MKSLLTINKLLVLWTLIFWLSACATIFNSKQPSMEIQTTPPGAKVSVGENVINCTSPCNENLKTVDSLPVIITMPGHSEFRGTISRNMSAYFWINGILGLTGLIGMGVDYLTDSMWAWEDFSVVLVPYSENDESKDPEAEDTEKKNEEEPKEINEPENTSISSPESKLPLQAKEQSLKKSGEGKEDEENGSPKREPFEYSSQQNNEAPFPSETIPITPSSNQSNPYSPRLTSEQGESSPKRNESKPKLEENSLNMGAAASRYPKELVVRRLEWHLGALPEAELKARTTCVYQVLDRHQGGLELSLDDAILLVESQKDICN